MAKILTCPYNYINIILNVLFLAVEIYRLAVAEPFLFSPWVLNWPTVSMWPNDWVPADGMWVNTIASLPGKVHKSSWVVTSSVPLEVTC